MHPDGNEGGVFRAGLAVRTLAAQAVAHGARVVRERARPDGAVVVLDDGTRLTGDIVVWACGPWLRDLFADLISLTVTQQELLFFDGGPPWRASGLPGWCDYERSRYGTADIDALGIKAAVDDEGPLLDPDADPPTTTNTEPEVRAYVRERPRSGGCVARPRSLMPLRAHTRHSSHRRAPPRPLERMACGRRLGPRFQARAADG
jgi:glycine/D-amino acid oxidase-like deaminating enzyme